MRQYSILFKSIYTRSISSLVCNRAAHKFRSYIDYSKFPELIENDLEEKFISGWGPGGQKVNKAHNAVFLRHIPSGLFVKVHQTRELHKNREIARELLRLKLDDHVNGEDSVTAQERRYLEKKEQDRARIASKRRELKARFKEQLKAEQEQFKSENSDV